MKACVVAVFAALLALSATAAFADKPPDVGPDDMMAGLQSAPALVKAAGLDCEASDARKIGVDDRTGGTFYELACKGGEGFVVALPKPDPRKPTGPVRIYSCLEAASAKTTARNGGACRLPENADPKAGIAALVAQRHPGCRMTDARALGHTDAATLLEVACAGGGGFIVQASYPLSADRAAVFTPCAGYRSGMNVQCALTDAAGANAYLASLVVRSGKPCEVKDHRYVGLGSGLSDSGDAYFEVACKDGDGFILDVDGAGDVYPTPCAEAGYIAGGCKLTRER